MQTKPPVTPRTDQNETTPGDGVRIEIDDARAGASFGVWKILAGSLFLALIGYAVISMFFIGDSASGG